jgi:hypothetical protein
MTQRITDWVRESRVMVVGVDAPSGRVRIKGADEACSDLACGEGTVVLSDDRGPGGLDDLNPGDIVRVETRAGQPQRIVVVRRVWDELSSPEF